MFLLWNPFLTHSGWGNRWQFERRNHLELLASDRWPTKAKIYIDVLWALSVSVRWAVDLWSRSSSCDPQPDAEMWPNGLALFARRCSARTCNLRAHWETTTLLKGTKITLTPRIRNSLRLVHALLRSPFNDRQCRVETRKTSKTYFFTCAAA